MPRLRVFSGSELCRLLVENVFAEVRQKGSHIILQKKFGNSTITVPVPKHDEIKIGTLQSIIRQSGLPRKIFETE